jgi:dihydroneopterin aldolase
MRPGHEAVRVNTTWSVRIERLLTQLRVGIYPDELPPQPVWVTLRLRGVAPAGPASLGECIDYEPLCRWITEAWPQAPHTPLLETRINELLAFAFDFDGRVQEVQVGIAKQRMSPGAATVGIERSATRPEFEAQRRHLQGAGTSRDARERTCDDAQPA